MAGHSKFKNIMYRKSAQDQKRAKVFARLIRELNVATRHGPDPATNPRLRAAIAAARSANMAKDTIERAISRSSSGGEQYEDIRYEGYGPNGVAVIVETLTDNRNRTASEIRAAFSKYGGNLGETNSVTFLFDRKGQVVYPSGAATADAVFEAALEAGASDVQSGDEVHEVHCDPEDFNELRDSLEEIFGTAESAGLTWQARTTIPLEEDQAESLFKMLRALEDSDDVQSVASNFEIDDDVLERLTG